MLCDLNIFARVYIIRKIGKQLISAELSFLEQLTTVPFYKNIFLLLSE